MMRLDIRSLWTQIPTVHLKIAVVVFLGVGITNLILGMFWAVSALIFFISGASNVRGAGPFFGGLLMAVLSVPLVFMSLLYVFCGLGILRHTKTARYGSMVLCLLLAPFTWDLVYTVSPRLSPELFGAVFVLSLYLLGVLIWGWERDDTSDLSLLKLGP
jgi:hypothetical protein